MNLFLAEHIDENKGYLGPEESHHASRVMRLAPDDTILVTLGKGQIYKAITESVTKKRVHFVVSKLFHEEKTDRQLTIAIAPTKSNDRFENFLEKATELGIHRIIPIICQNSERRVYKVERGRKVIQAAAKQSISALWPELTDPVSFDELISKTAGKAYIAYCGDIDRQPILMELAEMQEATLFIGPEGDFTPQEIVMAQDAGILPVSLGTKRLRTETAGMAVALAFNLRE